MDFHDAVERISQKFQSKGITVDRSDLESKLRRLVEEFGVHLGEAERTVAHELARQHDIADVGGATGEAKKIGEVIPGEWVTVEGKIVALTTAPSDAISQSGIVADPSGAIRFVTWARANAPLMEQGRWYRLESAVIDQYRGAPNLKIHSGTTISEIELDIPIIPSITPVSGLSPGVASVRAKMVQEWEPLHERMLQTGLLGDESGTIRFTIWKEEGAEKLAEGTVYTIYYTLVDEYNGRLSLGLNTAMTVPEEGDIEIGSTGTTLEGAIVHVSPGSGLIKRCPVDGCSRVLSRQNYCPVHEIQSNFRYDLRLKAVLDDGVDARNILMKKELVENLAGITLEEAIELAESNPLGIDEVFDRIREAVIGRYVTCGGTLIDNRLLVNHFNRTSFDSSDIAGLLNRAGGETA